MLSIYNTATRAKDRFEPIDPGAVRIYACGPTVYDYAHIGNARMIVVFDGFVRLLRRLYPNVTYVRNITDIDDKIIDAAKANDEPIAELTARTAQIFHEDMAALGCLGPDVEPRATDHIAEMIAMIEILLAGSHAYVADGHVLFDVASMADYGAFARRHQDELIAGARVEVAPYKKSPMDFVLWKPSDDSQPGWPSPWGRGRPGWHIECSAMAKRYLGVTFDIHGGGEDLVFPHHQNEIAQSCSVHDGAALANYWMHNGFLMVEGQKMSKSLGNHLTVHDLRREHPGEALRLSLLATHYRQLMDFTRDGIAQAKRTLDRWYLAAGGAEPVADPPAAVLAALSDDFNTPRAITELHRLADAALKGDRAAASGLKAGAGIIGLLSQDADAWSHWQPAGAALGANEIEVQIEARRQAREARDFARADLIRDELASLGIVLEDGGAKTNWRRAG